MDKQHKVSNKNYDKFSRNKESASFYATGQWKRLTKTCKDKFKGLDIYSYYIDGKLKYGDLSHHIVEISEDKNRSYDIDNLIWLSDSTHKTVHVAYNNGEKKEMQMILRKLIKRYMCEFI